MSFTESSHLSAKNRTKNSQKVVMAFGTFDLFHPGHIYYLSEAEKHGKKLIIVIARDHRVISGKGRSSIHGEDTRLRSVQDAFPDAIIILGDMVDMFAPLREHQPDILAFWYDQRVPEEKIRQLFPDIEILRIGGYETEKWKSSLLRAGKD